LSRLLVQMKNNDLSTSSNSPNLWVLNCLFFSNSINLPLPSRDNIRGLYNIFFLFHPSDLTGKEMMLP